MLKDDRKRLEKTLDDLAGSIVRSRGECERCGKTEYLQWSHIVSRTYKSIRWDLWNALCLCRGCHFWWHHQPFEAKEWFDSKWPGRYDRLKFMSQGISKVDLNAMKLYLTGLKNKPSEEGSSFLDEISF